jgi:hypothetical protein
LTRESLIALLLPLRDFVRAFDEIAIGTSSLAGADDSADSARDA